MNSNIERVVDRLRQFAAAQERNALNSTDPYDQRRYQHGYGILMDAANDIAGEEPWPGKSGATNGLEHMSEIIPVMGEFFCPTCRVVFHAGEPRHCKEADVVKFDPAQHGRLLIPGNNAMRGLTSYLEGDLKDDPLWEEAQRITAENGSASYVARIITYIDLLRQGKEVD